MLNNQWTEKLRGNNKQSRSSGAGCTRGELLLLVRDSGPDATTHAETFSSGPDRQENLMNHQLAATPLTPPPILKS